MSYLVEANPWERRARWLVAATIAWNLIEGLVATAFGWREGSVSLGGFGADSLVEVASAVVVGWWLAGGSERTAARAISALLVALGAGIVLGAIARLGAGAEVRSSVPSLAVGAVSLAAMVGLWRAKLAAAAALGSRALALDAACSRACAVLSAVLLLGGLAGTAIPAWGQADGVAAIALGILVFREGRAGWNAKSDACCGGESCCG